MDLFHYAIFVGLAFALLLGGMAWHIWRRKREDAAFRRAQALAGADHHATALRAFLSAEKHWQYRTYTQSCASKDQELARLLDIVHGAAEQSAALGRPLDCAELAAAAQALRAFYAEREHFAWDGLLVEDPALAARLKDLDAALQSARERLREQARASMRIDQA